MYTVKHAAALTGLPAATLRMWERRYGVVAPVRTEGGYRLYDDAAIARLTAMRALVEAGWAPSRAAVQVASGTTLGPVDVVSGEPVDAGDASEPGQEDLGLLVQLALDFDAEALSEALDQVFARTDLEVLVDSWLMPALRQLGQAWHRGEVSVAGEHFVSAGVQRRLAFALDAVPPRPGAPRVLVGLARGSRHELGILAFAVLLARAGLEVVYLGADIPPDSWVVAAATREPAAVVLAVPCLDDAPAARDTVAALAAARPGLQVLLGGSQQERGGQGRVLGHRLAPAAQAVVHLMSAPPDRASRRSSSRKSLGR